jgi:hypothetical protein
MASLFTYQRMRAVKEINHRTATYLQSMETSRRHSSVTSLIADEFGIKEENNKEVKGDSELSQSAGSLQNTLKASLEGY